MVFLILLIAIVFLVLCCSPNKGSGHIILTVICGILYFPVGVILALAKKYK